MFNNTTRFVLAAVAVGTLALPACNRVDPCSNLGTPSAAETTAANAGAEIERDGIGGVECELVGGRWQAEVES